MWDSLWLKLSFTSYHATQLGSLLQDQSYIYRKEPRKSGSWPIVLISGIHVARIFCVQFVHALEHERTSTTGQHSFETGQRSEPLLQRDCDDGSLGASVLHGNDLASLLNDGGIREEEGCSFQTVRHVELFVEKYAPQ